jgi:predicted O-methyltransferase YrrM
MDKSYPADRQGLPDLVQRALRLADSSGFDISCAPAVGQLLRLLAAGRPGARVGEIGTGCGVGTAWLLSGLDQAGSLVSVELDPGRAAEVGQLLEDLPQARVVTGDWSQMRDHGPFDLLFPDVGPVKRDEPEALLALLAPGGLILLDDLTPGAQIAGDPIREFWLRDGRVAASELQVSPTISVMVAARLSPRRATS